MLISCHWLSQMLECPGPLDPAVVSEALTSLGLEVEGQEVFGAGVSDVIVGEIRAKDPHPKADRLTVVKLFDGAAELQVVCGASNLPEVGGKVAFAPVGAILPGDFKIGEREIRGVASSGMICSETELEIGHDGDGILILPASYKTGAKLCELVPQIGDTVLELGVTPNRPDALGHIGVARDVATKLGYGLKYPKMRPLEVREPAVPELADLVTLEASAQDRCGRYIGHALKGVKVGPSPLWMRVQLHRLGLRSINNCVDITNYVLMEQGQPLHVFDRAKLGEGRVVVRLAGAAEPLTTLDGAEIKLDAEDLVIADAQSPQALAGVMGGADSMVSEATQEILLEAAYFA
ncbi:MAG: phenylalanine--tRNA ligase subunit beta, partial [Nannocystaceae bacterium]